MKKITFFLFAAILAMVSCNKEQLSKQNNGRETIALGISVELNAEHSGVSVKAVKTGWETNDVIYVFFTGKAAPQYLEMRWDGSQWNYTAKNSLSFDGSESGSMRAVYLPFGSDATVSADGSSFTFGSTTYSYYLTDMISYDVTGGKLSGTFHMRIPEGYVQFFIDDASADSATEIELREPKMTPAGIASISEDGAIATSALAKGAPLPGYVYDKEAKTAGESKGWLFSGILLAESRNATADYHFTLVKGGWQGSYYSYAKSGISLYTSESTLRAIKLPAISGWSAITDYKPIDLGMEVNGKRVYWSSRNLGATADFPAGTSDAEKQTTWGGYYAWGETSTKSDYSWSTYKYGTANTALTKYCSEAYGKDGYSDSLRLLEDSDDAARVNLGGIWRTPTDPEYVNLKDYFDWTEDTDYNGLKVSSKVEGFTDRYIWFPRSGYMNGTNAVLENGSGYPYVYTWSASTTSTGQKAFRMYGYKKGARGNADRFYGCPVRPVTD